MELVEYVASNARGEAESVAESSAPDQDPQALQHVLSSRRLTLDGGFLLVYDKECACSRVSRLLPNPARLPFALRWMATEQTGVPLRGPLSAALLSAARRSDNPVMRIAGQEYALGMAVAGSGKVVVAALPMPQGLNRNHGAHPFRRGRILAALPLPQSHSHRFLPLPPARYSLRLFLQRVAGAVPLQADHAPR